MVSDWTRSSLRFGPGGAVRRERHHSWGQAWTPSHRNRLRSPEVWLGDVAVETPIGRFACRGRTTDFDIINPNHEVELVRRIELRLSRASNGKAVFVDVGAHVGKYTVLAARLLGGRGRVVAIEPDPSNFAALTTNVAL